MLKLGPNRRNCTFLLVQTFFTLWWHNWALQLKQHRFTWNYRRKHCTTFLVSLTYNFITAEQFSTTQLGLRTQSLILHCMEAAEEELKLKQLSEKRLPHQLKCIQTRRAGIPKANFHRTRTQIALGRKLPASHPNSGGGKKTNKIIQFSATKAACPKSVLSLVLGANFRTPILKLKDFIKSVLWSLSHLKIKCKFMSSCGLNVWLTVINWKREKPKITSNKNLCQISSTYSWSVCSQSSHSFQP